MDDSAIFKYYATLITGYASVFLLALLYIPQVIYVYQKRDSRGLSMLFIMMAIILSADVVIYGILLGEWPLIISNGIVFVSSIFLFIAKFIFRENEKKLEKEKNKRGFDMENKVPEKLIIEWFD